MKILIVCSYRSYAPKTNFVAPFIFEQVNGLENKGCDVDYFQIKGKGIISYLKCVPLLELKIKEFNPDIIHAHFGLSGLFSNLQRKIPVVTTYHGSDINYLRLRIFSKISISLSKLNIFVSDNLAKKAKVRKRFSVIPCGVDFNEFYPIDDKQACRQKIGLEEKKHYILFSKMFGDPVKNYPLAKAAVDKLENAELVEFIGYSREEVCLLFNACDAAVMTSFTEGSPQFIKEAMACNCPIVSVDVGDVNDVIGYTENCYITKYDRDEISDKLKIIISNQKRTNGRESVKKFDNEIVVNNIINIYKKIIKNGRTKIFQ